jgi:hypothetical protein
MIFDKGRDVERPFLPRGARVGITVIEVLVALTMLSVVAASIVGVFSLLATLNRGARSEVDVGRAVRTISEKVIADWSLPSEWEEGSVGGLTFNEYVALVAAGPVDGPFCDGEFSPALGAGGPVRTVSIRCQLDVERRPTRTSVLR